MVILGLGFTDHETSAALVVDGELSTAIARERLTRLKRDGKLWGSKRVDLTLPIKYCLDEHGLTVGDVDLIVWNHIDHASETEVYSLLKNEGGVDLSRIPFIPLPHHFAHACCAFYLSPFKDAAVLVADGLGGPLDGLRRNCAGPESDRMNNGSVIVQNLRRDKSEAACEHESFYHFDGRRWDALRKIVGDAGGIGGEYGSVSEFLFGDPLDAGKTMGLAPYGRPYPLQLFLKRAGTEEMPAFESARPEERDALEAEITNFREGRSQIDYEVAAFSNFAASIQRETEEALLEHARWLRSYTEARNLCFSGGVALNCVANSLLAKEAGFDEIFVPPAPGDDGISIGCALYGAAVSGESPGVRHPTFLGRSYEHEPETLSSLGLRRVFEEQDVYQVISGEIARGAVVAWFQGGAELGPRALGHRSFLADPRRPGMRDYLNGRVKNREPFRPFAPVVIEEAVLDYFTERFPSYFMSFVADVREDKRALLPAISHVDGSARYQVLREQDNPQLYRLISAFAQVTGIPVLLNTSFNRAGEPLVETPVDAARCLLASSADYLVVDGHIYRPAAADGPL